HAWAVRSDQTHAQLVTLDLHVQHVEGRNAFGDTDDQLDTSECRFQDRILTEGSRHIDDRGIGARGFNRFAHGVENRQAQVGLTALAGGHATNHLGAVGNGLFRVEGPLAAGETLADDLGVLVDQNAHCLPPAALTTDSAALVRLVAAIMLRRLSASFFAPNSALLPSRRTTTGTLTPTSATAAMIPSAIRSQRTIPPKMFTSTALTLLSERMILKASVTRSLVAPPPTSRKLAGAPPCSLTMSMVPMARPAPFTM